MERNLTSLGKIWEVGSGFVVTCPKNILEAKNLGKGDLVEITWGSVIKNIESIKKTTEIIKEENKKLPEL